MLITSQFHNIHNIELYHIHNFHNIIIPIILQMAKNPAPPLRTYKILQSNDGILFILVLVQVRWHQQVATKKHTTLGIQSSKIPQPQMHDDLECQISRPHYTLKY